jgi:hypothetical protein
LQRHGGDTTLVRDDTQTLAGLASPTGCNPQIEPLNRQSRPAADRAGP